MSRRLTRRDLMHRSAAAASGAWLGGAIPGCRSAGSTPSHEAPSLVVNDVHSRLNATPMRRVVNPRGATDIAETLAQAIAEKTSVGVSGARHAMGGQAFAKDGVLLDMRSMSRLRSLDAGRGVAVIEAGATWPHLVRQLHAAQPGVAQPWTIVQKQTGANDLTLGGAVACNGHGRGLRLAPFVQQIERLEYVGPDGRAKACDRTTDPATFARIVGGYGLFGVVTAVHLRLMRIYRVRREVDVIDLRDLDAAARAAIGAGADYGDCQIDIQANSPGFLRRGVLATYHRTDAPLNIDADRHALDTEAWMSFVRAAINQTPGLFDRYAAFYRSTAGQVYDVDTMQMGTYLRDYAERLNAGRSTPRTLMLTELYVPVDRLTAFLDVTRQMFLKHTGPAKSAYSVLRLIQPDHETALPWATQRSACVIFNVVVRHDAAGIADAKRVLRRLIDFALDEGGRYYLTYHRWARRDQVERGYPMLADLLREQAQRDPHGVLRSDWLKHHRGLLGL